MAEIFPAEWTHFSWSQRLARFATDLRLQDLPADLVSRVKHFFIDYLESPFAPRRSIRAPEASPDRIEPALGDILGGSIKASRDKLENGFELCAVKCLEPL